MNSDNHKIYTCPMHPEIREDSPGMCPDCGMALIAQMNADTTQMNADKNISENQHSNQRKSTVNHDKHAGPAAAGAMAVMLWRAKLD